MSDYKQNKDAEIKRKIDEMLKDLPEFVKQYVYGRENRLASRTLLSYVYKLKYFFEYLHDNNSYFSNRNLKEFTLQDLDRLTSMDVEEFTHFLRQKSCKYKNSNQNSTIDNYLSTLSSFWTYFNKRGLMDNNPIMIIDRSKKTKKQIHYLDEEDKKKLKNTINYGTNLSKRQQIFNDKNKARDEMIYDTLLLTGMRISELVGLDLTDINFENQSFTIVRKGGNVENVYFGQNYKKRLEQYLVTRKQYKPSEEEKALFLNKYGTRISVRQIEKKLKTYVNASALKDNHITPHKLRTTFATELAEKTDNIRLVQERLGHATIATTQIYTAVSDKAIKETRNIIDDENEN